MEECNIIRLDDKKQVDDVVITGDTLRMERMSDDCWWVCVYRGEKRVAFHLFSKSYVKARLIEDDLGCKDDTKCNLERMRNNLNLGDLA